MNGKIHERRHLLASDEITVLGGLVLVSSLK